MRIGVLTTSFPQSAGDTAGCFVLQSVEALAARGHQLEVLAPEPPKGAAPLELDGVRTRWVPYLRPRGLQRTFYGAGVPDNLLRDPRAWPGLLTFPLAQRRHARRAGAGWDAVISHWALPSALGAAAVPGARPHLCVMHSADLHLLSRLPGRRALARRIAASASSLGFVSEAGRRRFVAWLPPAERDAALAKSLVQPMGVAPALADIERSDRSTLEDGRLHLLSLGRLVPVKGLLEAARELAPLGALSWTVAGDGPLARPLSALAAGARLEVSLPGSLTGDAKRAALARADAFLLPSRRLPGGRSEGAPHALLEAMAAGLPPIAAAVGGVPELIRHGDSGLLYDPESPGALARAVEHLRADPALRTRLAEGARRAAEPHRWPRVAERLERALLAP